MPPHLPVADAAQGGADRTPLGQTLSLAAGVMSTVRLSRALVQARREVDLTGLDSIVGLLCAKALDLPPEEGRALLLELCAVLEEVELLSAAIAEREHGADT